MNPTRYGLPEARRDRVPNLTMLRRGVSVETEPGREVLQDGELFYREANGALALIFASAAVAPGGRHVPSASDRGGRPIK